MLNISSKDKLSYEKLAQNNPGTHIVELQIGFVSGEKKHPLDNIYIYNKNGEHYKIKKEQISNLIPNIYQEYLYFGYKKS